jgi:hypothetical protein
MDHARGDYSWTCTRIKSNKSDDGDEQTLFLFSFFPFALFLSFCVIAAIAGSHANIAAQQHHRPSHSPALSLSRTRGRAASRR